LRGEELPSFAFRPQLVLEVGVQPWFSGIPLVEAGSNALALCRGAL
jgi:hypothetical protein